MSPGIRLAERAALPFSHECRPRLFSLADPEDGSTLEGLLDTGLVTRVHDTLGVQLGEWVKASYPDRRWSSDALARAVAEILCGQPIQEYGTWVFYPWSGVLVHVLPVEQFRFLRSVRNRYKLTPAEQEVLGKKTVAMVGLSVGLSAIMTMALEGIGGRFRLADFDSLGLSNLNRVRAGVPDLGTNKAVLAARQLHELDPYLEVEVYSQGITDENLGAFLAPPLDLLVEECDDLAMKVRLREEARSRRIPVLMESNDRGMLDVERFDREPDRPLLHGLIGDVRSADLVGLATRDKVPFVLRILDPDRMSVELRASLPEIQQSIEAWPQLGSAVAIGGGVVADAARRLLLDKFTDSGRFYLDVAEVVRNEGGVVIPPPRVAPAPAFIPLEVPPRPAAQAVGPLTEHEAQFLVAHAILAPSGGNCQPWRFEYRRGKLLGYVVPERTHAFLDFRLRGAYLALGAAAENVVLAASAIGLACHLAICPESSDPLLAFRASFARTQSPVDAELARYIPLRVTNRKVGPGSPLTAAERASLSEAVRVHGGTLRLLERPAALTAVAALMGKCDRYLLLTPGGHRDTFRELRFNPEEVFRTRDGLDVDSLELPAAERAALAVLSDWQVMERLRFVGGGSGLEEMARRAVAGSVAVGLVQFPGREPPSFVRAGRAVQRAWLTATGLGLTVQPWTALPYLLARLEEAEGMGLTPEEQSWFEGLRSGYRQLFPVCPEGADVMLWRFGRAGPPTTRSLRRTLHQVFHSFRSDD